MYCILYTEHIIQIVIAYINIFTIVCDAPPHGIEYHGKKSNLWDLYPDGHDEDPDINVCIFYFVMFLCLI